MVRAEEDAVTYKQKMLAAVCGEAVDGIPWVPRLDLWYNAHKRAGTLPAEYGESSLKEIAEDLGCGYHAVVPQFKDLRSPDDEIHRALGVYNLWNMPFRTVFENVEVLPEYHGDETWVVYRTPMGSIRTKVLYDESMRRAGISITHILEYAFKTPEDYRTIGYLFDNAKVEPNFGGYTEFADYVGEQGLAVAFVSLAGSPTHLLQRELMPFQTFFLELYDHPDELAVCAECIGRYMDRVVEVVCGSPAAVVFFGANYDATVTYPPFFRKHIQPWLARVAESLHEKGKYLLTHTDGENRGLLDCYLDGDIDVADSICPKPMTRLSFREVQKCFGDKITIMGGIPSVSLLPNTMPESEFKRFIEEFLSDLYSEKRLILGISDTTPPAAPLERLKWIAGQLERL